MLIFLIKRNFLSYLLHFCFILKSLYPTPFTSTTFRTQIRAILYPQDFFAIKGYNCRVDELFETVGVAVAYSN